MYMLHEKRFLLLLSNTLRQVLKMVSAVNYQTGCVMDQTHFSAGIFGAITYDQKQFFC